MKKYVVLAIIIFGNISFSEVVFNGPVKGGDGGSYGLINGKGGDVIVDGKKQENTKENKVDSNISVLPKK